MPPSPATRISPSRDLRAENLNRLPRLESELSHQDKEDDLALFNEVRDKERENFLLDSNYSFEDIFSKKLRCFSDHKLQISVPSRGEISNLLNDERDKNDYDWLITPPETPLFRSLDDEAPPQVNLEQSVRHRSRPIPIAPSPMMERGQRSSRTSASPHRRSPSPKPSKLFSVTRSSPPSTTGHYSPSKGHSPQPRSSTPTPRRIISSTTITPSRVRGTSPVKTGRGNSAPPKIKAWQSTIPGFSSEVPPNLRTSLADRPASYVRGSSPPSGNGRKSRSPGTSRSISSSRGSIVSSGDDDQVMSHSVPVVSKDVGFSRKQMRGLASSAPKKSLDLGRQMDRKNTPNMFRPLLSGVPSSTFHAGLASSPHHSPVSKYSSFTSTSNTSTNLATSARQDNEESEPNREDITGDPFKEHDSFAGDNIFVMDQASELNDEIDGKMLRDPLGSRHGESNSTDDPVMVTAVTVMVVKSDSSDASGPLYMAVLCSICNLIFNSSEVIIGGDPPICHECKNLEANSTTINPVEISDPLEGKGHIEKTSSESQHPKFESTQNVFPLPSENNELTFSSRLVIKQLHPDGFGGPNSGAGAPKMASDPLTGRSRSRSFTASNTSFEDFSYARDSSNSKRSTISASMSSSFDLGGFSRQTEGRLYRQSSGTKSDVENYRYETPTVHVRTDSSASGASVRMLHVPSEDGFVEIEEKMRLDAQEQETESICANTEKDDVLRTQELVPEENDENLTSDFSGLMIVEALPAQFLVSVQEEDVGPLSSFAERVDFSEVPNLSSFDGVSEIVNEDADVASDVDTTESIKGYDISRSVPHVCDESVILSADMGETKPRSLMTLDEATDVILFCSSIVHNLAYEAANIAINKETPPTEALRPTVPFLGGPEFKRSTYNTRLRTIRKRSSRVQRARQKKLEMDAKPPCNAEADKKSSPIIVAVRNDVESLEPLKLESKCNCVIM